MEEKSKLFVFDKLEMVLLLLFFVVVAAVSFTLGIRFGKGMNVVTQSGIQHISTTQRPTTSDYEMKSRVEESVDLAESEVENSEEMRNVIDQSESLKRTKRELEKLNSADFEIEKKEMPSTDIEVMKNKVVEKTEETSYQQESGSTLTGRYTIQLGAYNSKNDATDFASGFSARGYEPIVNEVYIEGKGKWYRVSIGVFNTVKSAKEYISKEKSLFAGQDYMVNQF